MAEQDADNEILDYEEQEDDHEAVVDGTGDGTQKKDVKGTYVSIHSSGFRDFLLKPELLRSIVDCGFEHPSEGMPVYKLAFLHPACFSCHWLYVCIILHMM